ncbi:TETRASPANIN family protein [Melia azedarach]|uniref:TETRASPANIN family protein n=1 Tax=Melia azedarach TaxID=155640 RepID=A0ACC1XQ13_MELAZ|nr:TETRASPANIN family protein [Melia azedarach]
MVRASNFFVGLVNFFSLLGGIIAIAFSLYIHFHGGTACQNSLFKPLIIIGALFSIVSLLGLLGVWFRNNILLFLYLIVMFLFIITLAVFPVLVFASTHNDDGGGKDGYVYRVTYNGAGEAESVVGFRQYRLANFSSYLRKHLVNGRSWDAIKDCLVDAQVCRSIAKITNKTAQDFYKINLSPIQSGCCKPSIDCGFEYKNGTSWTAPESGIEMINSECFKWSNEEDRLCFDCNSCKAGVLSTIKRVWRNLAICLVVLFIIIYAVGFCAVKNNRENRYIGYHGYGYKCNP